MSTTNKPMPRMTPIIGAKMELVPSNEATTPILSTKKPINK